MPLPDKLYLACSGGMDSMVFLHFLLQSRRDVICLYFNHGTRFGDHSEAFLRASLGAMGLKLICGRLRGDVPKGNSREDYWHKRRYAFFDGFCDRNIVTCHHLNDQIETYLQGLSNGKSDRLIPLKRGGRFPSNATYIRPFINVPRDHIVKYAERHSIRYMCDPSNLDVCYTRNRIRHNVIPELLKVNPGLYKSMQTLFNSHYDQQQKNLRS